MKNPKELSIKQLREEIRKRKASNLNLLSGEDKEALKNYRKVGRPATNTTLKPVKCHYVRDKQPRNFRVTREYDFLTYYGLVMKWALQHRPDLHEMDIKILLYLYGHGHFYKSEFLQVYHAICARKISNKVGRLKWLMEKGYVKVIRHKTTTTKELYGLTRFAWVFLKKIHRYCCGDEKIPSKELEMKKEDWRIASPLKKKRQYNMLKLLAHMDKEIDQREQRDETDNKE